MMISTIFFIILFIEKFIDFKNATVFTAYNWPFIIYLNVVIVFILNSLSFHKHALNGR